MFLAVECVVENTPQLPRFVESVLAYRIGKDRRGVPTETESFSLTMGLENARIFLTEKAVERKRQPLGLFLVLLDPCWIGQFFRARMKRSVGRGSFAGSQGNHQPCG